MDESAYNQSSANEHEFWLVSGVLDDLMASAKTDLRSAEIKITNRSSLKREKGDYLSWSYDFQKDWPGDVETARVTVHLFYGEPIAMEASPWLQLEWRAEVFQIGKSARVDLRQETRCSLEELAQAGIAVHVIKSIENGRAILPP